MKHGTMTSFEERRHALLNAPPDPNRKRPAVGWEDEDSTHDHWMKAMDLVIAMRRAQGAIP